LFQVDLQEDGAYNPEYEVRVYLEKSYEEGDMPETEIGKVSDFFARPLVAGIDLSGNLKVGDQIHIKGHTTDFEMAVTSMQIDNKSVTEAKKDQSVGIKVPDRVRVGDTVYQIT
jgi:translation initiation factor IF-2